jgi:predicted Holliday junction resolvase-like endonuclease
MEIILTNEHLVIVTIISLVIAFRYFEAVLKSRKFKNNIQELKTNLKNINDTVIQQKKENELQIVAKEAELKVIYQQWAIDEFEKFKQQEIKNIQNNAEAQYREAALVMLKKWKIEEEAKIRQDAINRSYAVNLGKITEHLIPFHQSFLSQFNPKDARFIGSPIDLIVFDGYADKRDEIQIYLVEIKTGTSKLTDTQKKIKASVISGNIRWAEINPDDINGVLRFSDNLQIQDTEVLHSVSNDSNEVEELISCIVPIPGESKDSFLERIASAIQGIGALMDSGEHTLESAAVEKFKEYTLNFYTESDKVKFIDVLTKVLNTNTN